MKDFLSTLNSRSKMMKFHSKTKLTSMPEIMKDYPKIWIETYFKEYPRFTQFLLPAPTLKKNKRLFETIYKRKSIREYSNKAISINDLSTILYFSAGINELSTDSKSKVSKRMYPSGGARYPLELYTLLLEKIGNLERGLYHYHVKTHALELLQKGKFRQELKTIIGGVNKKMAQKSPLILFISAVFGRTQIKYGDHSYRIIFLEAGHLAQNIYLTSQACEIGCCAIGGFVDDQANSFLDLRDDNENAIYMLSLGRKK